MVNVLIVEDSLTVLQMASDILTNAGHYVMKATNGEEALQIAADKQPDVILLDVILPMMNGYEVCRQIKSTPETAAIPVVMITSKNKESDRFWGMEQGADDYITKPFEMSALLEVIGRFGAQVS